MGSDITKTEVNPDKWMKRARLLINENIPCEFDFVVAKISRIIPWHVTAKRHSSPEAIARIAIKRLIKVGLLTMDGTIIASSKDAVHKPFSAAWASLLSAMKTGGIINPNSFEGMSPRSIKTYLYEARKLNWITFTRAPDHCYDVVWSGPDDAHPRELTKRRRKPKE